MKVSRIVATLTAYDRCKPTIDRVTVHEVLSGETVDTLMLRLASYIPAGKPGVKVPCSTDTIRLQWVIGVGEEV